MRKVLNAEPHDYSKVAIKVWKNKGYSYVESSWQKIKNTPYLNDVKILIIRLGEYVGPKIIDKFPNLDVVVSATTGHDHIDIDYLNKKKIKLISLRGEDDFLRTIPSTAEHTWALLLALVRNIPLAYNDVLTGAWNRDEFKGYQLKNKTIGIVGLGRTGSLVAKYAEAFDMKVIYYDPYNKSKDYTQVDSLAALFDLSEIISLHIHFNKETANLIDRKIINLIKQPKYIINTSRGGVWDEKIIAEAFKNGKIAGLATDVLATELQDIKQSNLWQAQQEGFNIIITPHIAGATYDAMRDCEEYIVNKVS